MTQDLSLSNPHRLLLFIHLTYFFVLLVSRLNFLLLFDQLLIVSSIEISLLVFIITWRSSPKILGYCTQEQIKGLHFYRLCILNQFFLVLVFAQSLAILSNTSIPPRQYFGNVECYIVAYTNCVSTSPTEGNMWHATLWHATSVNILPYNLTHETWFSLLPSVECLPTSRGKDSMLKVRRVIVCKK